MKVIVSSKDKVFATVFTDVRIIDLSEGVLSIVMNDAVCRNYPLVHIWYYETEPE